MQLCMTPPLCQGKQTSPAKYPEFVMATAKSSEGTSSAAQCYTLVPGPVPVNQLFRGLVMLWYISHSSEGTRVWHKLTLLQKMYELGQLFCREAGAEPPALMQPLATE